MSNVNTQVELVTAFKARLPGVHLRTLEESRAILALRSAVAACPSVDSGSGAAVPRTFWKWSAASGLWQMDVSQGDEGFAEVDVNKQPQCGLDEVFGLFQKEDANVVLALMDPWDDLGRAIFQRYLRESLAHARGSGKCIVLVGRDWNIPLELQKDIFICDLSLPSYAELVEIITDRCNVYKEKFAKKLTIDEKQIPALARACTGLTIDETGCIVALSCIRFKGIGKEAVRQAIKEKSQVVRRTGILEYEEPSKDMSDVGGLTNLKGWIKKRGTLFSEAAEKAGIKPPKGVLAVGIAGTGKTLLARAIASAWQQPLVRLDAGKLFGSLVGESESNLRSALRTAEAVAPCVMLIDEIEKGFGGGSGNQDGGTSQRVFGALLTWMQDQKAGVFVVGTANLIDKLDPALIRRFDATFAVDLPDFSGRSEIFNIHLKRSGNEFNKAEVESLSKVSVGFTGAEIEKAVQAGLIDAFAEDRKAKASDILNAVRNSVPISKTMAGQIDALREFCKSGRAMQAGSTIEADKAQAAKGINLAEI